MSRARQTKVRISAIATTTTPIIHPKSPASLRGTVANATPHQEPVHPMTDAPVLEELAAAIATHGATVKDLKGQSPVDATAVQAAVAQLLDAKRAYAAANNGIGVDGKPYVEGGGGKKAKPKKAPAEAGPAKPQGDPNSANAQKKAAKKAEKAAKKAAFKAGGPAPPSGGPAPASAPAAASAAASSSQTSRPPNSNINTNYAAWKRLPVHALVWNPSSHDDRPLVALTTAILTNTILDYQLVPDFKAPGVALGLPPNQHDAVQGDVAIARYMARQAAAGVHYFRDGRVGQVPTTAAGSSSSSSLYYPTHPPAAGATAVVDMWIDYAVSLQRLDRTTQWRSAVGTLEKALAAGRTFCTGPVLTMADVTLFAIVFGFPTTDAALQAVVDDLPADASLTPHTRRWLRTLAVHPALQQATQLWAATRPVTDFVGAPTLAPLVTGMNALEGALPGQVVTRFPPEPSGYLHIGHAKAVLLNDYYARRYQGRLILRFDDTNPSKEKDEYMASIVVDLAKLGVTPDLVTYASDYFDVCAAYARQMMQAGLAYMDDTPQHVMKEERSQRQASKYRDTQTPAEALAKFDLMCSGDPDGAAWCLRAKIDMQSDNGTLRDPVLYRQNLTPHHRTGNAYKAYPTYDFSCPIVDSIEGVTHALRTTEYNDRDEQFQWIAKALGLRRPRNHAFSRVNFEYTELSKRKLTKLVERGIVTGWDDARMPTVRGVVRRGIDITALRSFMYAQGASRNVVNMVWHSFWAINKKEIDPKAKRFMAIDAEQNAVLTVTNGPAAQSFSYKGAPLHPKDASMGSRAVRLASKVLLETEDVEGVEVGEEIVLLRWGVIKITQVDGTLLEGEYIPDGDFRKAKRKLTWLADVQENTPVVLYEFDHLVTKPKLEEDDNFDDFINPTTLATTKVIGDAGLKTLQEHDIIQLERRGFYRVDRPYLGGQDRPIELYMIPDGRSKAMGGKEGKLAHH